MSILNPVSPKTRTIVHEFSEKKKQFRYRVKNNETVKVRLSRFNLYIHHSDVKYR